MRLVGFYGCHLLVRVFMGVLGRQRDDRRCCGEGGSGGQGVTQARGGGVRDGRAGGEQVVDAGGSDGGEDGQSEGQLPSVSGVGTIVTCAPMLA